MEGVKILVLRLIISNTLSALPTVVLMYWFKLRKGLK